MFVKPASRCASVVRKHLWLSPRSQGVVWVVTHSRTNRKMGNTATVQADQFEKLKVEFESKKDTLSDEQLFNHMKSYYEGITNAASQPAADAPTAPAPAVAEGTTAAVESPP
jgi:hypothetical protein